MKKLSFLLIFVLIFAFFSVNINSYELFANPVEVVYAEEQSAGNATQNPAGGATQEQTGGATQGGENGEQQETEEQKNTGLNILGVQISGVWFWLAFAVGVFTIGFYCVRLVASYRKTDKNKED